MERPEFVSEPLEPVGGFADTGALARGEPSVPVAFIWRGARHDVARVLSSGRVMGEDRGDTYLRRHTFEIETTGGLRMAIYFERNPSSRPRRKGWWVYTVTSPRPE
jgi:hypothetical protein